MVDASFWKGKKVYITGHTGFKGSWMVTWLTKMGAKVTGYALPPETTPSLFSDLEPYLQMDSQIGDICDFKKFSESLYKSEPEIIFHMAAQPLVRYSYENPLETFQTNIMGTANLLQAARELKSLRAIVVITTDKVYENIEKDYAYHEQDQLGGHDPYSSSKACAEIVTSAMRRSFFYSAQSAMVSTVRAGNVIGGGDWAVDRIVPDVVRAFQKSEAVSLRSPGAIRPWQHVLEPLSGYLKLAEKMWHGDHKTYAAAWNFGPDLENAVPVEDLVSYLAKYWTGVKWQKDTGNHPHEAHFLKLKSGKAKDLLGWTAQWGIEKTARMTIDWYRRYHNKELSAFDLCISQINDYIGN